MRFGQVDPVTATQENYSTYQYGWNNPVLRSDPNGDLPCCSDNDPAQDPFLFANLAVTAFYDTKHAIYNTALRLFGSDTRADYKVENGSQIYQTEFKKKETDNTGSGVLKETVAAVVDLVSIIPGGSMEGKLLSEISKSQTSRAIKATVNTEAQATISDTKSALKQVYQKLGIQQPLPKGERGKFGSPTAGDSKKGYRLDPAHPDRPKGDIETVPHINYWDWTGGKKGNGGKYGAIPLIQPK